jgi:hypothetical protein
MACRSHGASSQGLPVSRAVSSLLAMASSSEAMRGAQCAANGLRGRLVGVFEQVAHGGRELRQVVQAAFMHRHQHRPDAGLPEAADEGGAFGVAGQAGSGRKIQWHGVVSP